MRRCRAYLFIAIFLLVIFTGSVCGADVIVQVLAKEENITPLAGALVYTNTTLIGKTDDSGTIQIVSPDEGSVPIRIEKFGYDPWEGELGSNTTQILVELERAKIALSIQIYDADTMEPVSGVALSLKSDGTDQTGTSDMNGTVGFLVQARKSYGINAGAEHYQPVSMTVDVGTGSKDVQIMLFREDRFSLIVKDAESGAPLQGARVLIEGIDEGATDARGILTLPMPRGKVYFIRIILDGYQDYNGRQIVEINTAFLTIPLSKAPYTIVISVYDEEGGPVEGARILIDNTFAGTTSRYGRTVLNNLTQGRYLLEIQHKDFIPESQTLTVAKQGEDITTELSYRKENVTIQTIEDSKKPVSGVKIVLNGKEAGHTGDGGALPVSLRVNLPYTILAEKDGYHTALTEEKITTSSNATTTITVTMERNFNWMIVGFSVIIAAVVLGLVLIFRNRSIGHSHGRRGRL